MRWAEAVAQRLSPSFGGFPTFCADPDDLLEEPAVREALASRGVSLGDWSGERDALAEWLKVSDEARPLVKVARDARLHLIDEGLPEASRLDVGVSLLFPKLDSETVRAVPKLHWDALLRIQDSERPLRTRRESALMVARVVYGVDHAFVQEHGWTRAVAQVAASGEPIPTLIVEELLGAVGGPIPDRVRAALGDAALARAYAKADAASGDPFVSVLRSQTKEQRSSSYDEGFFARSWSSPTLAPTELQALALRYGAALSEGLPNEVRAACNEAFGAWLRRSYDLMLTSQNPNVHRTHRLAESIDRRLGEDRGVVFVIDALSLEAWFAVKRAWIEEGVMTGVEEAAAFAVVPTLTSWSRRAFFEGRLPPQFEQGAHGPALERKHWERRFERARYFSVGEEAAYREAIYQGAPRIAVVDVSWDKRGHALDPDYDTLAPQARMWAARSRTTDLVREALKGGYRVFVTADHGQIDGRGIGMPNVGKVPEDRSKRVLVFGSEATRNAFEEYGDRDFQPMTVPTGTAVLFARYGDAFDQAGASSFSHGGCSVEEVMVPFVELTR